MNRRSKKQWYQYHLAKAQNDARSEVMEQFAAETNDAQQAHDKAHYDLVTARGTESWVSYILALIGIESQYRRNIINPIQMDVNIASRALRDVLERQRLQLEEATRVGTENYLKARDLRNQEALDRAERVAQRKYERRVRYLERSPSIRSAARILKKFLIRERASAEAYITCYYCAIVIPATQSHLEHKHPISRGGDNRKSNLALSCADCNLKKGRKTQEEFMRQCGKVDF